MNNEKLNYKTKLLLEKYKLFIEDYPIKQDNNYYTISLNIKENLLNLFQQNNYSKVRFSKIIKKYKLNPTETIEIIIRYTINQKNNYEWNMDKIKKTFTRVTDKRIETIQELLDKLLNETLEQQIYNLIETSIQNHIYKGKNNHLYNYSYLLDKDNYKEIYNKLQDKLRIYKKVKNEIEKKKLLESVEKIKQDNLERAYNKINEFIISDISNIEDFCKSSRITVKTFNYYAEIVKENNKELYTKYIYKCAIVKQRNFILLLNTSRKIIEYLKNGIEENGIKREFDLLDYYLLTKTDRSNILKILKEYEENDAYLFVLFIRKYHSKLLKTKDINAILNSKDYIGVEFDKNNKPIPNSGYEVTKEDKETIFKYLKENNIPLLDDLYLIALKRYLNSNLLIDNYEKKSLTKNK